LFNAEERRDLVFLQQDAILFLIFKASYNELDENTELHGIPKQAWKYKPGNRRALEWILDQ